MKALGEFLVSSKEEGPKPEELHFLGVLVVGENVFEIRQTASVWRPPISHAKACLGEPHLRDRGWNGRDHQDEHHPRAETEKERRVAGQREHRLDEGERLRYERQWP